MRDSQCAGRGKDLSSMPKVHGYADDTGSRTTEMRGGPLVKGGIIYEMSGTKVARAFRDERRLGPWAALAPLSFRLCGAGSAGFGFYPAATSCLGSTRTTCPASRAASP